MILQLNIIKISKKGFKKKKKNKSCERCQSLCIEEKEKNQHYGDEQYKNLPKHEKQKLIKYRKKYKTGKNMLL